ncbi:phosphatase PAP2 family protein [Enemella sp. A6]|uniref:phosphatase PAP2 family protein n=1 Tax=Enemella sp. A6 TaxID=3440152 RepID=UPI003EB8DEC3
MPSHAATTERPLTAGLVVWHLLGITLAWGSTWVLARVALGSRTGQWLDERALQAAHALWGTSTSQVVGSLRSALDMLPTAALVVGAIAVVVFTLRSRRALPALVGISTFAASLISVQILKRWILDKPDFAIHEAALNSFPSGHTALAAAAGLVVVLASPARYRPVTGLLAAVVSALTGASTVINAWHRPSDAIAAILITCGWGLLGGLFLCSTTGRGSNAPTRFLALWLTALGVVAMAIAGGLAWLAWPAGAAETALLAGMFAIVAGAALSWGLLTLILQHR